MKSVTILIEHNYANHLWCPNKSKF